MDNQDRANEELSEAIDKEDAPAVSSALTAGADCNLMYDTDRTVLGRAVWLKEASSSTAISQALLSHGAYPDKGWVGEFRYPPLVWAALNGRHDLCRILLQYGADPDATNYVGYTGIWTAACCGHRNIVELILQFGGDPTIPDDDGVTPAQTARGTYPDLANWLQEQSNLLFPRGLIHIFNYNTFDHMDSFAEGAVDTERLHDVFNHFGYTSVIHENLTKEQTDKAFIDILQNENLAKNNVVMFYILSLGSDTNIFYSSDGQKIDISEKINLFNDQNCPGLKGVPKFWLGDFCSGSKDQSKSAQQQNKASEDDPQARTDVAVPMHTQYLMSSNPGIASNFDKGFCFTETFVNMLKDGYTTMNNEWFTELNKRLRAQDYPSTARFIGDPFPGELFSPGEFSFDYNVRRINAKRNRI